MQSFLRHLQQRQIWNLAETAFELLNQRGVHPLRFVEWYAEEGSLLAENEIPHQAQQWLQDELFLVEGLAQSALGGLGTAAGWMGGHAVGAPWRAAHDVWRGVKDGAKNAFATGVHTAGRDIDLANGKTGIQQHPLSPTKLYDVKTGHFVDKQGNPVDKNRQPLPAQAAQQPGPLAGQPPAGAASPQAAAPQQAAPAGDPVKGALSALQNLSKHLKGHAQEAKIQSALQALIANLNNPQPDQPHQATPPPVPTAPAAPQQQNAWHVPESPFLSHVLLENKIKTVCVEMARRNIDPNLFVEWYAAEGRYLPLNEFTQGIRDFFGKIGGAIKGAWNGMKSGWSGAGQGQQNARQQQAIQAAVQALQQLQPQAQQLGGQEMLKNLNTVLSLLGTASQQPAGEQPAPGGPDTNAQPAETPTPEAPGAESPAPAGQPASTNANHPNFQQIDQLEKSNPAFAQIAQRFQPPQNPGEEEHTGKPPQRWEVEQLARELQPVSGLDGDQNFIQALNLFKRRRGLDPNFQLPEWKGWQDEFVFLESLRCHTNKKPKCWFA